MGGLWIKGDLQPVACPSHYPPQRARRELPLPICMRNAYILYAKRIRMGIYMSIEDVVAGWHTAVNDANLSAAESAVSDPIVVLGPKGAGRISRREFAGWMVRSGIRLRARSFHPVSHNLMVVEQDASWPDNPGPTRVATLFRVTDDRVSAALRFPALRPALDFGFMYDEMVKSEMAP